MLRARPRRIVALVAAGIALFLVADGLYAGLRFRSTFTSAACDLKRATDAVEDLDLEQASERLVAARDAARRSHSFLRHPSVLLASSLPRVRDDVAALDALTRVAEEAAGAGLVGLEAAERLGFSGSASLSAVYEDGRVRFDTLSGAREAIARALTHLERARGALDESPTPTIGPVRGAFFAAGRTVAEARKGLEGGRQVLEAVPGLLGDDGPRRYFLAFQSPSEARAGGGLVGVYGILRADGGAIEVEEMAPIRALVPQLKRPVQGPRWFERLYGDLAGLRGWREANQSPSFPVVSEILLEMYEASTGERLDGVIAMDPYVLGQLTRATGPIEAEGMDVAVGPDNAIQVLLHDIYVEFERREDEQNEFLRDLVDQLWSRLASGDVDGSALAKGLADAVRTQHLKMYSAAPTEQLALEEAGLAADPAQFAPNVQMLFHNNFAANKVDWFLERSQRTRVTLADDGSAEVTVTVFLRNNAPRGERSLLKKSDVNELPSGLNQMSLHLMVPEGAEIGELRVGNQPEEFFFRGREQGRFPVIWVPIQIKVQDVLKVDFNYRMPAVADLSRDDAVFTMNFLPQALVTPDEFELEVIPPDGYRIGRDRPGARFGRAPLELRGSLGAPRAVAIRLLGPGAPPPAQTDLRRACP